MDEDGEEDDLDKINIEQEQLMMYGNEDEDMQNLKDQDNEFDE